MTKYMVVVFFLIFHSVAQADTIAFPDPGGVSLFKTYIKHDKDDINELKKSDNPVDSYILGHLYFIGNEQLGIPKNNDEALKFLSEAWRGDVIDSGFDLALIYYSHGKVKDFDKSRSYMLDSGDRGYVKSQRTLARAYAGEVLENAFSVDRKKSIEWYEKAARSGDQDSADYLSFAYRNGNVVDEDPKCSFYWREVALKSKYGQQELFSFRILAKYYEKGYGTSKNLVESYKYYDLSGTGGTEGKTRVAKNMTDAEIQEAIKQSRAWQEEHNIFVPSYYGLQHQSDGSYR